MNDPQITTGSTTYKEEMSIGVTKEICGDCGHDFQTNPKCLGCVVSKLESEFAALREENARLREYNSRGHLGYMELIKDCDQIRADKDAAITLLRRAHSTIGTYQGIYSKEARATEALIEKFLKEHA